MDSVKRIEEARENLRGIIHSTPVIYSEYFSEMSGNEVYIKPENYQKTGAFKIRGAYNRISKLTDEERACGVICSSAGNHAQGVAYAAQQLGVQATIVMPNVTPLIKIEATRSYGAEVIVHGEVYDDAYAEARRIQKETGAVFIHPFDDWDVVYGQGTIGLEILEDVEDVDIVLVPVGGGGLISGICLAIKENNPNVRIIGVEPEGAQTLGHSIRKKSIVQLEVVSTVAEGVAVRTPGKKAFKIVQEYVDEMITIDDRELLEIFTILIEKHKMIAETAGILPLAALKKLKVWGKKIVCVVSGGNIDVVNVSEMINRSLISRGRLFCFTLELPDKPGELLNISKILAEANANIVKIEHNQFKTLDRLMRVALELTVETNGQAHIASVMKELEAQGYSLQRVY
ncbi:threonine ammonia-lyase [Gottschalkiaceae bacterium SANA]|nr:threonine ammonia-lyase [Gottschalkiaceae bacterium SANA]